MSKYDVAVIGSGPGGYICAIRAAQLGLKTVCIEKKLSLGGTCLNMGCIPSKTLLHSSEMFYRATQYSEELGLEYTNLKPNLTKMMANKEKIVDNFNAGIKALFKKNSVDHIQGFAEVITPYKIKVVHDDTISEIDADYIVLATGSEPIELPTLNFDGKYIISSTEALSLQKIPTSMIVIGGGAIGLEVASIYNRLGSSVKVVELSNNIGGKIDPTIALKLEESLTKQGIQFVLNTKVSRGKVSEDKVSIMAHQNKQSFLLDSEIIMVSIGRKAVTKGLGLENIGVQTSSDGYIPVDDKFRSCCPNIFAIGDLIESPMLAHTASAEGTAVAEIIAGLNSSVNYFIMPNIIYTSPEVAVIGLTEDEAKNHKLKLKIGQAFFKNNSRAHCCNETSGMVKIIAEEKSEKIIGLHILGPKASEIIMEGAILMRQHLSLNDIIDTTHPHPTFSETIYEAALDAKK